MEPTISGLRWSEGLGEERLDGPRVRHAPGRAREPGRPVAEGATQPPAIRSARSR